MLKEVNTELVEYPEKVYGTIFIRPSPVGLRNYNTKYGYNVDPVDNNELGNPEVCFWGWVTNDESENWVDHGYSKLHKPLQGMFPLKLFYGVYEGDVVSILFGNQTLILTCKQEGHRMDRKNFHTWLYEYSQSFGGVISPNTSDYKFAFNDSIYTELQQKLMIKNAHITYCDSINHSPNTQNFLK